MQRNCAYGTVYAPRRARARLLVSSGGLCVRRDIVQSAFGSLAALHILFLPYFVSSKRSRRCRTASLESRLCHFRQVSHVPARQRARFRCQVTRQSSRREGGSEVCYSLFLSDRRAPNAVAYILCWPRAWRRRSVMVVRFLLVSIAFLVAPCSARDHSHS